MLSGCTINYNLEIKNDSIDESIIGTVTKEESDIDPSETSLNPIYTLVNMEQNALFNSDSLYKKNLTDMGNYIEYEAKYSYNNNFKDSNIINSCFENYNVFENEDFIDVHLYGDFYCQYADKTEINVKTNLAVLENNADEVNNNIYSWFIDDSEDIDITLVISKEIEQFTPAKEKSILTPYQIITIILLFFLIGVSFVIYKKRNSEN